MLCYELFSFVGLDVGKKNFGCIILMSADEKELSHKSFDNTPIGIQSAGLIAGYHLFIQTPCSVLEKHGKLSQSYLLPSVPYGIFLSFICC